MPRPALSVALIALLCASAPAPALADLSKSVITSFRGQLVISKAELPEGKDDKETIAKIKTVQLKDVTGNKNEDLTSWHFHYTAFVSKTGHTSLRLEFLRDGKLAANQQLDGIDPKSPILSGDVSINEDEGIAKGKKYTVQLLAPGNAVVAKTTLTMN